MSTEKDRCQFDFTDHHRTVIACKVHGEREVLRPAARDTTLAGLAETGQWAGSALALPATPPPLVLVPAPGDTTHHTVPTVAPTFECVEYATADGQTVALSVFLFRQLLCPNASEIQARYMLGWCQHNRIDPFSNEAYFAIMDGKPVIQVSKDAWFRRMERHPAFVSHDSGILVETTLGTIRAAVLGGFCPYLVSEALQSRIVAEFAEGKPFAFDSMPECLIVRKRGQFLGDDTLIGGWAEIRRTDRPLPYTFQIDKKGWEGRKKNGDENHFWEDKAPFMIWKTALKNCTRLAFPELAGLIAQPETQDLDSSAVADAEFTIPNTTEQKRKLFARGREIAPPLGPLAYEQLHVLAGALYDGKGISELTMFEMAELLDRIDLAAGGDAATVELLTQRLVSSDGTIDHRPDLTLGKHRER